MCCGVAIFNWTEVRVVQEEKLRAGSGRCDSAEDFALFNLAEDPYEEHPYLYGTGNTTSDHAYKCGNAKSW